MNPIVNTPSPAYMAFLSLLISQTIQSGNRIVVTVCHGDKRKRESDGVEELTELGHAQGGVDAMFIKSVVPQGIKLEILWSGHHRTDQMAKIHAGVFPEAEVIKDEELDFVPAYEAHLDGDLDKFKAEVAAINSAGGTVGNARILAAKHEISGYASQMTDDVSGWVTKQRAQIVLGMGHRCWANGAAHHDTPFMPNVGDMYFHLVSADGEIMDVIYVPCPLSA